MKSVCGFCGNDRNGEWRAERFAEIRRINREVESRLSKFDPSFVTDQIRHRDKLFDELGTSPADHKLGLRLLNEAQGSLNNGDLDAALEKSQEARQLFERLGDAAGVSAAIQIESDVWKLRG
jgi:hypothetical protein